MAEQEGQTQAVQKAQQTFRQANQRFLNEIGQLARQIEQIESDESLKQKASRINTLASQLS